MTRISVSKRRTFVRFTLAVMALSIVTAACTSSSADTAGEATDESERLTAPMDHDGTIAASEEVPQAVLAVGKDGTVLFDTAGSNSIDAQIIRDGRLDVRIDVGSFGTSAEEIRMIASDLGGYVASGETHIEEFDDDRYAVGWYTIRIPSDRFDEAVARVERLGERVSASLSSQDVTEEYVDLEGRLNYWQEQEQFYSRLMDEATTVDELVTVQTRMQDVLLNIEQIEGRLRYLDSRTDFATLTVGLTEVPGGPIVTPVPTESGPIAQAFEQAGEVLLATVAFIIVAAAIAIPIGILVLMAYGVVRLFVGVSRRKEATPGVEA